jgi:hypothetical protein
MKKIKPEDVAYELRELSKNTSLSPEVINIISHGYERICQLERERDEARRDLCDLYVKGQPSSSNMTDKDYAAELDWDCFKEDGK